MNELKSFVLRAFDYKGRSNRRKFIFPLLLLIAYVIIPPIIGEIADIDDDILGLVFALFLFLLFIPFVSLCVRRLHDTGYSGWWLLINIFIIPIPVFLIYLACVRGATNEKPASKGCFIAAMACALAIPALSILSFAGLVVRDYLEDELPKIKCRSKLRNMYYLLDDYQREHGAYPILDPDGDDYGVRDLYLLFENNKKRHPKLEVLLQPPGRKYEAFSKELSIDDFNTNHIGWAYNAKARPGTDDPLLVEGGFWRRGSWCFKSYHLEMHLEEFKRSRIYEIVLLANGRRVYIERDIYGNLSTNIVQDWSVLRE